jgi:hypothetical protein
MPINALAQTKLDLVQRYVDTELSRWPQVQGIAVVGSVAQGTCRADSDVDAYVFFHPAVEEAVVPAESYYVFSTGEYHHIFADLKSLGVDGPYLHLDAKRVALSALEVDDALFEGERAQLAAAILAWNRDGRLASQLSDYVHYPEGLRRSRLLSHLGWADYLLAEHQIDKWVRRHGLLAAHHQVGTATDHLIRAIFAYNRRWEAFRSLWVEELSRLPWRPEPLPSILEQTLVARVMSAQDIDRRAAAARALYAAMAEQLAKDGFMPEEDPGSWLFRQTHPGLGYAHNMAEWQQAHRVYEDTSEGL